MHLVHGIQILWGGYQWNTENTSHVSENCTLYSKNIREVEFNLILDMALILTKQIDPEYVTQTYNLQGIKYTALDNARNRTIIHFF